MTTNLTAAFKFKFDKDLNRLCEDLSAHMGCEWMRKDSHYFGDYLALKKEGSGTVVRIFFHQGGFLYDMINRGPGGEAQWALDLEEIQGALRECGATDFTPTSHYY